jgi:heme-degrading monooxygenase HmoA
MKPHTPYYAVIFTNTRTQTDAGYNQTSEQMLALAAEQPGFLGVDHARQSVGITVSYWESLKAIADWKAQADHALAREKGRELWYEEYSVRICKVEREYHFSRGLTE